ncbi:MAG: efflux RND transporter periplasmic adaptor subunit [Opitutaceae bacterium]|nr:efflux RND transporter periplasmic adaptor subunit [Cytophagales bacterium]
MKSILKYTFLFSMALLVSCKEKLKEEKSTVNCLSDTLGKMIMTNVVHKELVYDQLKLSGLVNVNDAKMIKVFPLVGGQVQTVLVELGDFVKKGQILAVLKSAEAAEIQKDIIGDSSRVETTAKNLQVAKDMYNSGLLSEKDLIQAKNEYKRAIAEYDRSVEIYDIYSLGKNSKYIIRSPMEGFIVTKDVNAGMELRSDNQSNIFTISNLSDVWVLANVYESDIPKIKVDYPVTIQTVAYPDKVFSGKIDKVYNVIDPDSKVLKVRIALKNPGLLLKPGMFATIVVKHISDQKMISVPSEGVIFDNNKNWLMVYKSACEIETREVDVHSVIDNRAYINQGVIEGEKVITKYQLLVYNAFN